jgi:hypothetical protein
MVGWWLIAKIEKPYVNNGLDASQNGTVNLAI